MRNVTDSSDDCDAVEESPSEGPGHRPLVLLPVPALLLQGDDQLLLKPLEAGADLRGPVLLVEHLHPSEW